VISRQPYIISTVAFEGIVLLTGALRLYSRWSLEGALKADDILMLAALVRYVSGMCD